KQYTDEYTGRKHDFEDFDIQKVAVSGEFNMWSRDNWTMKKADNDLYELRKKLSDFSDQFSWEFKFVINSKFWAEPYKEMANTTPALDKYGSNLNSYNLRIYTARVNKNGNTYFKLQGYTDAKEVILTGSFIRWDEQRFKMHKTDDGWEIMLQINPGEYEYKFIVDGNWMEDPQNPSKRRNEFDGYNSVINVQVPVIFKLEGYNNAKKVVLTGSFNDWNTKTLEMDKTETGWELTVLLSGGKHHYKFFVNDKEWITDPSNTVKEYDENGYINSVKMVK
ncbi:MAG TPA: glycogen-binding domain-containing protein, partial [Flavobacteriaceae bacterium]|nr:glycogen-binding domain-containing protein [Flavobacteriaceae bacterium]